MRAQCIGFAAGSPLAGLACYCFASDSNFSAFFSQQRYSGISITHLTTYTHTHTRALTLEHEKHYLLYLHPHKAAGAKNGTVAFYALHVTLADA